MPELAIVIRGRDEATGVVQKFTANVEQAGRVAVQSAGGFDSFFGRVVALNQALDLAGRAAAVARTGFDALFAGIERGGAFADLAAKTGASVEALSSLELAAKTTHVSLQSVALGLKGFANAAQAAKSGSEEASTAFAAVGISAEDVASGAISMDKALAVIADKFATMPDGAQKTALAVDLLGRSGQELIPLLNEGGEGLRRFQELSAALGLTIDTQTAKSLDAFGDNVTILGAAVDGVAQQFAVGLAPAIEGITNDLVALASQAGIADGTIRGFGEAVGGVLREGFQSASVAIKDFVDDVQDLGLPAALAKAEPQIIQAVARLGVAIGVEATKIGLEAGKQIAISIAQGIVANPGIFVDAAQAILNPFQTLGAQLVSSFAPGAKAFGDLQDALLATVAASNTASAALGATGASVTTMSAHAGTAGNALSALRSEIADASVSAEELASGVASNVDGTIEWGQSVGAATASVAQMGTGAKGAAAGVKELDAAIVLADAHVTEFNENRASFDDAIGPLNAELAIWQQVEAQLIDVAEAHRQIAIAQERAKGLTEEQARAVVQTREQVETLREKYGDLRETVIDLSDVLKDSFSQAFDAVIAGTRSLGDSLEGIALGIGKRFFEAMLDDKLNFDAKIEGNFLELGSFGEGVFGKIFSGAADFVGSLFGGGGGGSGGFVGPLLENGARGTTGGGAGGLLDSLFGGGGGAGGTGSAIGGAALGAIGGFFSAKQFGDLLYKPGATGLTGIAQQGAEGGLLSYAAGANQIGGAIIGAILSAFVGPLGGVLGGAISSAFGSLILNSIDRDALRNQRLSGPLGNDWMNAFVLPGALGAAMNILMPIPTLGEAFRRGGESIIDSSNVFGGTDGTGGLQAMFGDFTRSNAKRGVKGVPDDLRRNFDTGAETAIARGFTQGQADLVTGGAGGIFNFIARKEEFKEDAGRFGLEMGQSMAEFLSRGLAEGMTFDEVFGSLRTFADEAGITLSGAIRNLPDLMASVTANALAFSKGTVDATAAAEEGAAAYAQSLLGITAIFQSDFPAGVDVAAIALSTLEKDGVKAFGEITRSTDDWLKLLADSPEEFQKQVAKLAGEGFTIDTAEFEARLADISASAVQIGSTLGAVFTSDDVESGIDSMIQSLRGVIGETFGTELMSQLFDKTSIASAFEPVFMVLRNISNFDLTTATGVKDFGAYLTAAIAQGRANLEEYKPILKEVVAVSKEWQEALEEALAPGPLEALSDAWTALIDSIEADLRAGFASAVRDGINAGFADGEVNFDAGLAAFRESFRQNVYEGVLQGIIEAVAQSVVIEALAPMIAEGKRLWLEALDPNSEGGSAISAAEQARIDGWGTRFKAQTDVLLDSLGPFFESIFGQWGFFLDKTTDAVDSRTGEPTYSNVGGPRSGIGRAATGGFFSDAAIVGEAGYPELVQTVPGGFHVTPLSWSQANMLMGAGAQGLARGGFGGGATTIGGRSIAPRTPGDSYGGGVGGGRGPVLTPGGNPGDSRRGGGGDGGGGSELTPAQEIGQGVADAIVNGVSSGLEAYARGGPIEDLEAALKTSTYEGILGGMLEAVVSGPAIEKARVSLRDAFAEAMEDGVIDATEAESLGALGTELSGQISAAALAAKPGFDALATSFGVSVGEEVKAQTASVGDVFGGAIRQAFEQGQSFEEFAANAKVALYEHVRDALVGAFIDSVIIKHALQPLIDSFESDFTAYKEGAIDAEEFRVRVRLNAALAIGEITSEEFKTAYDLWMGMVDDYRDALGIALPQTIAAGLDPIIQRGQDVVDLSKDICGAKCQLEKETLDYGFAAADNYGRLGQTLVEHYVPREHAGGMGDINTYAGYLRFAQQDGVIDALERGRLAELYHAERRLPRFDGGGIARGPESGYLAMLHGEEMVLSRPRRLRGDGEDRDMKALVREVSALRAEMRRYAERPMVAELNGREFMRAQSASKQDARKARANL